MCSRGLSWNFWWLGSANHVKFTEERVMCVEKHIVMLTVFWDVTIEKGETINSTSYCQLIRENSPYLLNITKLFSYFVLLFFFCFVIRKKTLLNNNQKVIFHFVPVTSSSSSSSSSSSHTDSMDFPDSFSSSVPISHHSQ